MHCLDEVKFPNSFGDTNNVLIPERDNQLFLEGKRDSELIVRDLRSISLCSLVYKILSKTLSN